MPDVLLSGDHAAVDAWRRRNAIERTARLRPDLLDDADLTTDERAFACQVMAGGFDEAAEGEA